jgi:hypothetical protein
MYLCFDLTNLSQMNGGHTNLETHFLCVGEAIVRITFHARKSRCIAFFHLIKECFERQINAVDYILQNLCIDL